jgi:Helicase HerA, central domain
MKPIKLGTRTYDGAPVFIDAIARGRHTYISGQTGTGKSALLLNIAAQIAIEGEGLAFFDPHGDIAAELLTRIPRWRADELVVIDLADLQSSVGLNFLVEKDPDKRAMRVDNMVTSFIHVFGKEAVGDRSQALLRNSLLALMAGEGHSLLSVVLLLRDNKFREKRISKVTDPLVRSYWFDEFENYDPRFREQVTAPILNKLDAMLSHVALRNALSQPTCSVNFRQLMDQKRILIVQLRKGTIGEQASKLMGNLIFAEVMRAALSRDDIPEKDRVQFDCIIDEVQNVVTADTETVLSEARKYRLCLTLANQFLDQIPDHVLSAIFGNVGTYVAFRSGANDAVVLNKQFQGVAPSQFLNLPNFHARVRPFTNGAPEDAVEVTMAPPPEPLHVHPDRLLNNSRIRFGTPRADIEKYINHLFSS